MPPMGGNFSGGSLPGVGDLLSQSWQIFISNAGTYIGIAILPIIIQIIGMVVLFLVLLGGLVGGLLLGGFQSIASSSSSLSKITSVSSLLLFVAVGLIIAGVHILSQTALIYTAAHREKRIGLGEAFGFASGKLFSFLWVAILSIMIIGGGSLLFIIPGILFAIWFILAPFVLIGEDARGMTALLKSREYIRGNGLAVFWRLFAFGLIVGLAFFALYLGISIIGGIIIAVIKSSMVKLIAGLIFFFIPFIIQPIVAALNAIYTALIYEHLRAARPAPAFAPSIARKAVFLVIGILGLILPVLVLAGAAGSLFSQKTNTQTGINIGNIFTIAAQAKQRDVRRLTDVKGIQNSLELYFVDHDGYPAVASPVIIGAGNAARLDASGWSMENDKDAPVYMIKVPASPMPGGANYIYSSVDASGNPCTQGPSCAAYTIIFKLESGAGGYEAGELIASPPDVIIGKSKTEDNIVNLNSGFKNCGKIGSLSAEDLIMNEIDHAKDRAFVCLGEQLLNKCEPAEMSVETKDMGKTTFRTKGKFGINCLVEIKYGNASQIKAENFKIYADKSSECSLNIKKFLEPTPLPSQTQDIGSVAAGVYAVASLGISGAGITCTSTVPRDTGAQIEVEVDEANDSDGDGLIDALERTTGTNVEISDTDFDGLSDGDEVNTWKTKPTNPDTDGDGFRDGDEVKNGYNPLGGGKTQ